MSETSNPSSWLERLRGPSAGAAQPYLDGIRAVAVIMIFVRHAWGHAGSARFEVSVPFIGPFSLAPFVMLFSNGVDLFFVLSGFLLSRSFLLADYRGTAGPPLKAYWGARILRIGPPYWVMLFFVLFLGVPSLIRPEAVYSQYGAVVVLVHVFFGQTVYMPAFGSWGVETPFWTLTIEMIFYALLPFMVRAFYRWRWVVTLPLSAALAFGWLYFVRYDANGLVDFVLEHSLFGGFKPEFARFFLSHTFPAHVFHFAAGITICNLVVRHELGVESPPIFKTMMTTTAGKVYLVVGSVLVLCWMHALGTISLANNFWLPTNYMITESGDAKVYYFFEEVPFAFGFALIVLGSSIGPASVRRLFGLDAIRFFGVIGYAVYLVHMPLLYHANTFPWIRALTDPAEHFWALAGYAGLATVALSTMFFIAIERPAMAASKAWFVRWGALPRGAPRSNQVVAAATQVLAAPILLLTIQEWLVVAAAVSTRWLGARASFLFDDFYIFSDARRNVPSLGWMMAPIYGHINPGLKIVSKVLFHYFGFHYSPFIWVLSILHAAAVVVLLLLLRTLGVALVWRTLFALIYATSAVWYSSLTLWTSGIQVLPVELLGLTSVLALVSWHIDPRWWKLGLSMVAWVGAIMFHEFGLIALPAGVCVCVALRLTTHTGLPWMRLCVSLGSCVLLVVMYMRMLTGPTQIPGEWPGFTAIFDLWADGLFSAWLPALFGGPLEWHATGLATALPPASLVYVSSVLFCALVGFTVVRNWRSVWWWAVPFGFYLFQTGLVGYVRLNQLGPLLMRELRYVTDLTWILVVAASMAVSLPALREAGVVARCSRQPLVRCAIALLVVGIFSATALSWTRYEAIVGTNDGPRYFARIRESLDALRAKGLNPGIVLSKIPGHIANSYLQTYADTEHVFDLAKISIDHTLVQHDPCVIQADGSVVPAKLAPVFGVDAEDGGCLKSGEMYGRNELQLKAGRWVIRADVESSSATSGFADAGWVLPRVIDQGGVGDVVFGESAWVPLSKEGVLHVATHPREVRGIGVQLKGAECLKSLRVGKLVPQ